MAAANKKEKADALEDVALVASNLYSLYIYGRV
jgi:hypothetical protein